MFIYNNVKNCKFVVSFLHELVLLYVYFNILLYIYIYIYIYHSIPLTLGLIGRDGGFSCGFACQQRVLKTFPGPGYLRSEDGVV